MRKYPLIPDMEPTTEQSKDTNVVQLSETMSFITVIYRIKMAQGHLSLSPEFTQTCVTVYESWNLQAAQHVEECPFPVGQLGSASDRKIGWSLLSLGCWLF